MEGGAWIDREELAWAAGFFDGEGCFSYTTAGNYGCVSIAQTEREPLERFLAAVGTGQIYGPYDKPTVGQYRRKPQFVFRVHRREQVQAIAAMLWFKLGSIKRQQAASVLSRYSKNCRRGHPKIADLPGCPRCVADAWAAKRRLKAAIDGQFVLPPVAPGP